MFRRDTQGLECWQASFLVQLRTGHVPLQKHLHRIGKVESPVCPACRTGDGTVYHYLMVCPAYTIQRRCIVGHMRRAARSVGTLLSNPKAFPHLFKFIHDSRQFRNIAGEP